MPSVEPVSGNGDHPRCGKFCGWVWLLWHGKCLMYSAEIAGDEEDKERSSQKQLHFPRRTFLKAQKEAEAVPVASLHNCGNFNHIFCGCIYVVTVCTGQSASEGWSLRVWRNSSRSIREARAFPGIYVSDFQNERYSENIYVPRCRA